MKMRFEFFRKSVHSEILDVFSYRNYSNVLHYSFRYHFSSLLRKAGLFDLNRSVFLEDAETHLEEALFFSSSVTTNLSVNILNR
jgi:hypothetical protein